MQINQVMKSYTQPNFDQILYEERSLSQFVSEMFDSFCKILPSELHNTSLTVLLPLH